MKKPTKEFGLVGRCFVTFRDGPESNEKLQIQYQGIVRGIVEGQYILVQYFDFVMGELSTMALFRLQELCVTDGDPRAPGEWMFFEDDEHLRNWLDGYGRKYQSGNEFDDAAEAAAEGKDR